VASASAIAKFAHLNCRSLNLYKAGFTISLMVARNRRPYLRHRGRCTGHQLVSVCLSARPASRCASAAAAIAGAKIPQPVQSALDRLSLNLRKALVSDPDPRRPKVGARSLRNSRRRCRNVKNRPDVWIVESP
jgi:hypothetical protein